MAALCSASGYIDAHLLAAVRLSAGAMLWTRDKSLRRVASTLGLHPPPDQ